MAILIIEDDARTQETLSRLVKELSFESIELARSHTDESLGAELAAYPTHLKLLVCEHASGDAQSRALLPELERHPHLHSLPVIWLIARGPRWLQSWWLRRRHPRVDDVLSKPFDREELAASMNRAYRRRMVHCDTLLYLGDDGPIFRAVEARLGEGKAWREIRRFSNADELGAAIRPLDGRLGAILIDPAAYERFGKRGLHVARDGVAAQRAVAVCLSRDPVNGAPLGPFCDRFVDAPADAKTWDALLGTLRRQLIEGWRTRLWLQAFKEAQKAKDDRAQRRLASRLARRARTHSETHTLLGSFYERRNDRKRAIRHLEEALVLNPFFPRTYLLLLKLYAEVGDRTRALVIAERAAAYCPHHKETQTKVAEVRAGGKS